jgi:hypothetical protein
LTDAWLADTPTGLEGKDPPGLRGWPEFDRLKLRTLNRPCSTDVTRVFKKTWHRAASFEPAELGLGAEQAGRTPALMHITIAPSVHASRHLPRDMEAQLHWVRRHHPGFGERMLRVHTRLADDRKKRVMQFYDTLTYERQLSLP